MRTFVGVPDLGIEVVSPSSTRTTLHAKVAECRAAGTRRVWIVDPEARTVTVCASLFRPQVLGDGETLEGEDVIPEFRSDVGELFAI